MDINSVITEKEYNSIRQMPYNSFCDYLKKLVKLCVEESLKALPTVMTHLTAQVAYLKEMSDEFYKKNQDLIKHKPLMAKCIEKVEGENPGLTYDEVLVKAARLARSKISVKKVLTDSNGRESLDVYDKRLNKLDG